VVPELDALGYDVVAISADRPERLVPSLKVKDLPYALYSDAGLDAARAFGIAFQVDDETLAKYAAYGIDLEAASGRTHHQLPVPSVFLVDRAGTVRWVYSNPDYRVRPDNATLLEAARSAAQGTPAPGSEKAPGHSGREP
jgi:peroxiredoxin